MDAEGSRRLILGAVQQGAAASHPGLARPGRHRPARVKGVEPAGDLGLLWTADELALVGVLPDAEVGRRVSRSRNAVRIKREQLGLPDPTDPAGRRRHRPWTAAEDELVRALPAAEAAARTSRTLQAVYQRRHDLGVTDRGGAT
jgi:hypothetical protein